MSVNARLLKKNPVLKIFADMLYWYPSPINLSYLWNFGSLAGLLLVFQIISGIFLAMHYTSHIEMAFNSVEHIMRDVNYGWLWRYMHANGASMFFLIVYIHVFRGLFYGSFLYPREFLWITGVVILLLMILTAFLGYVLPWGQMSFWAATVITNLASAIPVIGNKIVLWLWGGFAVDNATLNRFFSLHYLFPFLIVAFVGLHLIFLHEHGSNNPLGISSLNNNLPFHPYFVIKDFFGLWVFLFIFFYFSYFFPNVLGHSDNYIPANPLVTPTHIVPEWYFLPFYAILRSIPDKLFGVLSLLGSIIMLFFIPFFFNVILGALQRNFIHQDIYVIIIWFFFFICVFLGWVGGKSIEQPFYEIGQLVTCLYFGFFGFLFLIAEKQQDF